LFVCVCVCVCVHTDGCFFIKKKVIQKKKYFKVLLSDNSHFQCEVR